jgi:SAM-dependent methyltransferase
VTNEYSCEYAIEQIRRSRHPFRKFIKGFYLRNILQDVIGPSIDFACGAGQLLARLPRGSVGVEINPFLIEELVRLGLNVRYYDAESEGFSLSEFSEGHYSTFIMSHVLEHFTDAAQVLRTLLGSCKRIGVQRIIVVLPGWKGYLSDRTHKTFIDRNYLQVQGLLCCEGYRLRNLSYFPVNKESFGRCYVFNEMIVVFDRVD